MNAGWGERDWNADKDFASGDLVAAFTDGGLEQGPRPAVAAVPEPMSLTLLFGGLVGLLARRRTR